MIAAEDEAVIAAQLGRAPRGLLGVAHRCPCGLPDVAETAPRLPDGSPFPTLYYLTCPRAAAAVSKLEAAGLMREMTARLADDGLRRRYEAAHRDYLARREQAARAAGVEPLPPGTQSAGGMPERVKCLHALVAHELAAGGVNPFGREALDAVGAWWLAGPCVNREHGVHGDGTMTRRVAAVDCGTNSLRLLLADVDPGRAELTDVIRRMEIVRLGQGVDETGQLAPEALARTMAVLRDYADVIAGSGAQAVRMVATSATRDAGNAAEFVRMVKEVLGVAPEVLTGDEEAVLSFTGATAELAAGPDPGPFLVADIGGGSTEFVLGPAGGPPAHGHLGQRRLRPDDRAAPARRPADGPGGGGGRRRHRRGPGHGGGRGAGARGQDADRAGRLGHHGRGHRDGTARLRRRPDPPRPRVRGRCATP